jgi:hypothetical protein
VPPLNDRILIFLHHIQLHGRGSQWGGFAEKVYVRFDLASCWRVHTLASQRERSIRHCIVARRREGQRGKRGGDKKIVKIRDNESVKRMPQDKIMRM